MTVIKREHTIYTPYPSRITLQNTDGGKYLAEMQDNLESKVEELKNDLEYEREAKEQAIKINYDLENRLRGLQKEIEMLNNEINQLNQEKLEKEKLYKKALDENTELEEMNRIMMNLVYIFAKRELGL